MNRPPFLARSLLQAVYPAARQAEVDGDLLEGFNKWATNRGSRYARWRYRREVALIVLWRGVGKLRVWRAVHANRARKPAGIGRPGRARPRNHGRLRWLRDAIHDVRYGARVSARSPAFATVAVLILGLGIGANTTIFTLVHTVFVKAPPLVESPAELVAFTRVSEYRPSRYFGYPDYKYYRDHNDVFSGVLAYDGDLTAVAVSRGGEVVQANAWTVSRNFFQVLGVRMAAGRGFVLEESEMLGASNVVILSDGFWRRAFGADPEIVNQTITLNGHAATIVGVAPRGFRGVSSVQVPPDIYVPVATACALQPWIGRYLEYVDGSIVTWLRVLGRRKPGVDIAAAQANVDLLKTRWESEFASWIEATGPGPFRIALSSQFQLTPFQSEELGRHLKVLFLVAGAVLLIACANVAILLLARAAHRHHEIGVRVALGAGRLRVVRQLLAESLLLSVAGGVTGTLLAFWSARATAALFPISFSSDFRPDASVIAFATVVSLGATVLFGLAPAMKWTRADVVSLLRRTRASRLRISAQNTLVVGQVAMAIVLVTGAGLFVRSLRAAQDVDLGFEPRGKVLMSVELESHGYSSEEGVVFSRLVLEGASELPGVVRATTSDMTPFRGTWSSLLTAPGTEFSQQPFTSGFNRVGPGYFEVMGIPIVAGRGFLPTDDASAPNVIVVNQEVADRVWPGETALGKTVVQNDQEWTVVGVARDAVYYDIGEEAVTQTYLPQTQDYDSEITFVVQTLGDAAAQLGSVERVIRSVDPNVAISNITTLDAVVDAELSQYRVLAILVTLFGCLALFLAAIGLYGAQSFLIARRTREIGIRLALGAMQRQVAGSVLGRGMVLTLVGITVGVTAAYVLSRFVRGMLFGVSPHDPLTFFSVPFVLLAVAAAASLIPARRAGRVDAVEALREE